MDRLVKYSQKITFITRIKKNKRNTYYHSDGQFSILISDDDLFTGMFSGHYSNPTGFCFDIACTDEPINDNPKLQGYNVEEKV